MLVFSRVSGVRCLEWSQFLKCFRMDNEEYGIFSCFTFWLHLCNCSLVGILCVYVMALPGWLFHYHDVSCFRIIPHELMVQRHAQNL